MMLTISLSAQRGDKGKRGEKIEQQRVVFITTELDLTVEEAEIFWPLYNDYQKAKDGLSPDRKRDNNIDEMTEEESRLALAQTMNMKKSHIDLEINFMQKLENVLPAKKRLKLVRAEREFKKSVLKRYKERMKKGDKMKGKRKGVSEEEKDRN